MDRTYESHIPPNLPCPDPEGCKHFKAQIALQDENARLKALLSHSKTQLEYDELKAEYAELKGLIKELLLAIPECCWRKCWNCGRKQIHREAVTPGVLCRFCGSQDTRLLKKETQALKGE